MRKVLFAAALIGGLTAAGSASAAVGQCYDRFGNPVGPAYNTDHPNYGFLDAVHRRGGSCTGANNPYRGGYYGYGYRGYGYRENPYNYNYNYNYYQRPYYGYRSYYNNYYNEYPYYHSYPSY